MGLRPCRISSAVHSTTLPPLRVSAVMPCGITPKREPQGDVDDIERLRRSQYEGGRVGASPSGKASVFGTDIPRFESWRPSQRNDINHLSACWGYRWRLGRGRGSACPHDRALGDRSSGRRGAVRCGWGHRGAARTDGRALDPARYAPAGLRLAERKGPAIADRIGPTATSPSGSLPALSAEMPDRPGCWRGGYSSPRDTANSRVPSPGRGRSGGWRAHRPER